MKFFNRLIKWVLVITAGLSAALLAIIFLSNNPVFNQFLLRLVVLIAMGFMGGLGGRVLFSKVNAILTVLIVLIANLISLLLIDLFYETPYQLDVIAANFDYTEFSISDGAQILTIFLVSLIPLLFLRQRSRTEPIAQKTKPRRERKPLGEVIKPVLYQINPVNWQIFKAKPKPKKRKARPAAKRVTTAKSKSAAKPRVKKQTGSASTVSISKPAKIDKPVTKIKPSNGRKPAKVKPASRPLKLPAKLLGTNGGDVKLVGEEEHVCPYCLEEVEKGDKAGVVVCPECGTWHHQDCWNLTGSCGVAHRNEL